MGNLASLFDSSFGNSQVKFLVVGLNAAGKTEILKNLKLGEIVTYNPTKDFAVETVKYNNISFTSWALGGNNQLQHTSEYLENVKGLIFVVDSNDRGRFDQAREELFRMCNEYSLKDADLLVFANKQDLPGAATAEEVTDKMGLHSLRNRKWSVQTCLNKNDDGLLEGIGWLTHQIKTAKNISDKEPQQYISLQFI